MIPRKFLSNYLVINEEDDRPIAEYDSNAAPPFVGIIVNLEDIVTRGVQNRFRVISVKSTPLRGDAGLLRSTFA
jgi:hypothetical protein